MDRAGGHVTGESARRAGPVGGRRRRCSSPASPGALRARLGTPAGSRLSSGVTGEPGYLVYWDQNEEVDFLSEPSADSQATAHAGVGPERPGVRPARPERAVRRGPRPDPAEPAQPRRPEALQAAGHRRGVEPGQRRLHRPGPLRPRPVQDAGPARRRGLAGRRPRASSTTTAPTPAVPSTRRNLFATDIGTAQGSFPPPDDGRLVEWFAPSYTVVLHRRRADGGRRGPHHVDGTGGLSQPGMMAVADNGDLLMPDAGTDQVVRIDHTSFPADAAASARRRLPAGRGADLGVLPGELHVAAVPGRDRPRPDVRLLRDQQLLR